MKFPIDQVTGRTTLDADDRNEALLLSTSALASRASLFSVLALGEPMLSNCVERSGTGIIKARAKMCGTNSSLTMNSAEHRAGLDYEPDNLFQFYRIADLCSYKPSVH